MFLSNVESKENYEMNRLHDDIVLFPFFQEISIHRELQHDFVVKFFSFFEDDLNVYVILELCNRKVRILEMFEHYQVSISRTSNACSFNRVLWRCKSVVVLYWNPKFDTSSNRSWLVSTTYMAVKLFIVISSLETFSSMSKWISNLEILDLLLNATLLLRKDCTQS